MAKWKEIPKDSMLRKGYQIWYGSNFGFYVDMQKMHINMPIGQGRSVIPYGCKRGQEMVGIWNPNALASGSPDKANVYIPKNRITKIKKVVK